MPKKSKPPGGRGSGKPSDELALEALLGAADLPTMTRLRETLAAPPEPTQPPGPLALVDELLRRLESPGDSDIAEDEALIDDVVAELVQLAVERGDGESEARRAADAVDARLEAALRGERLDAASLVLLAKILTDSKWTVPLSLKTKLVETLNAAPMAEPSAFDLKHTLRQIADAAGDDAFAAYEALSSVLAAFPSDAAARMIGVLAMGREPVLLHTLAGFVMHEDPAMAFSAVANLKNVASAHKVESALVERLVRMRPWLPTERRSPLDEAIRALRAQTLPPRERTSPTLHKAFVMACDGMGSAGALATMKGPQGWGFVAAMTRPSGVAEVMGLEDSSRASVDATVRGMRESVVAAATDAAGIGRYLQICLGENAASGTTPPFRLLGLVESLGLGPLAPRSLSPGELIDEILENAPAFGPAAMQKAHLDVAMAKVAAAWFEAGDRVERLLRPLRGSNARTRAVLGGYLTQRREFWGRICAMSALALSLGGKPDRTLALNLARVGREILSGSALENIPLMRQVAETTVLAFEDRV